MCTDGKHDHTHSHKDRHNHTHSQEEKHDYTQPHTEHAVLDIGDDVGALIIYTPKEFLGLEIEVSLINGNSKRTHTAVLERRASGKPVYAALYLSLQSGEYNIWKNDTETYGTVTVNGGEVAQLDWRKVAVAVAN